jgi:ATPase subunit of ABC transporter with duplicated ATPase domains
MTHSSSLAVRGISKFFGPQMILQDISFTVSPAQKIGIVGPNGIGKSTLLGILAGGIEPDSGTVRAAPAATNVGLLAQETERIPDETVQEFLLRRTGVDRAVAEFEAASVALGEGGPDAADRYNDALEAYLSLGAADFDARVGIACAENGFDQGLLGLPMTALSGGQAARAALVALVLSRFDIYLLDEPTNDLDFAGLDRLERFVNETAAGIVIVSHDRAFLERTITSVVEIDEHHRTASVYDGGWEAYLENKALARRHAEEAYEVNQSQRADLKSRSQQQREWSTSGVNRAKKDLSEKDKFIRNFRVNSSEHVASKARATDQALERLEKVEKPWEGWELRLQFKSGARSGDDVASLRDAVIKRGDFVLGPVNVDIHWAERIAITGPNGAGKSTLLQALLGRIPLTSGEQMLGKSVVIGEIDQARQYFASDLSLADVFAEQTGVLREEARSTLAKFGLTAEHVNRQASLLSPGERTRASLAFLMAKGTNLLVLDEPTNHLDMTAIEQLEIALGNFDGTVLLITHDRRFLDSARVDRTIDLGQSPIGGRS